MTVLTVNTGSSSVRLALFVNTGMELRQTDVSWYKIDEDTPERLLEDFLKSDTQQVNLVSHRVVHGGSRFTAPCIINDEVEEEIGKLAPLAPLHNPLALKWIHACKAVVGHGVPQIAVFDTAFYASLPQTSKIYALPKDLCDKYGIRRYGFHGIAHRAMLERWIELRPDLKKGGRIISLQLGSGCSITAIRKGMPIDTSMGFSPIEGLIMSTRCGDLDPGILVHLQKSAGLLIDEVDKLLNRSSGIKGISGISGDMRVLLESSEPGARLAVEVYCYRVKKYIGAYMAALGGADAVLLGGGVGENAPSIRKGILDNMQWCGIELDSQLNNDTIGREGRISSVSGSVDVWIIPVDEAVVIAQEAMTALK